MKNWINKSVLALTVLAASVSLAQATTPCNNLTNSFPCISKKKPPVMPPTPRPIPTVTGSTKPKPMPASWPSSPR